MTHIKRSTFLFPWWGKKNRLGESERKKTRTPKVKKMSQTGSSYRKRGWESTIEGYGTILGIGTVAVIVLVLAIAFLIIVILQTPSQCDGAQAGSPPSTGATALNNDQVMYGISMSGNGEMIVYSMGETLFYVRYNPSTGDFIGVQNPVDTTPGLVSISSIVNCVFGVSGDGTISVANPNPSMSPSEYGVRLYMYNKSDDTWSSLGLPLPEGYISSQIVYSYAVISTNGSEIAASGKLTVGSELPKAFVQFFRRNGQSLTEPFLRDGPIWIEDYPGIHEPVSLAISKGGGLVALMVASGVSTDTLRIAMPKTFIKIGGEWVLKSSMSYNVYGSPFPDEGVSSILVHNSKFGFIWIVGTQLIQSAIWTYAISMNATIYTTQQIIYSKAQEHSNYGAAFTCTMNGDCPARLYAIDCSSSTEVSRRLVTYVFESPFFTQEDVITLPNDFSFPEFIRSPSISASNNGNALAISSVVDPSVREIVVFR